MTETTFKKVLKEGVPGDAKTKLSLDRVRKIKLKEDIPKGYWYNLMKGKVMQVYLFKGYSGAISASFRNADYIRGDHYDMVKYIDGRNRDIR